MVSKNVLNLEKQIDIEGMKNKFYLKKSQFFIK